jgi:hypothetical protein
MVHKLQRWTGECIPTQCDINVNVVSTLFWVNKTVWYTGTNIQRNALSQYFVHGKMVAAVFHWNNGSQLTDYVVSLPRKLGIGLSLHTHEVCWVTITPYHMTDFWETYIPRLERTIWKYFLKGQAVVHFKFNHDKTLPSHSVIQWMVTTDQNSVTICFSSKLHS